jgi:competence protein ComEC
MGLMLLSAGLKVQLAIVLPWASAWLAAAMYAALSGFGVSTQRALIMLTVAALAILSRRNVHPLHAWLVAMALVLLADPVAPLRAGFWFSFVAVGVLLMLFIPRFGRIPAWRKMLLAQLGISLVMAPLGMYWFQQTSLPGLLANLVAIPVTSMLIVPSLLAAMLLLWLPGPAAGWLLNFAAHTAHWLMLTLERLATFQPASFDSTPAPVMTAVALAMLGAAAFMLPRGTPGRLAGLLLILPLLLPRHAARATTEPQVDFLDVGQGLSVLVTTRNHLLVFDTGPGNGLAGEGGRDMVEATIEPMIEATGLLPDLVIASHADLDHAGGLESLMALFPHAAYLASLPDNRPDIRPCMANQHWDWDGLQFRVLHPSPGLPYMGNDSSCVIGVKGQGFSLLLPGDISRVVEQRLLHEGIETYAILSVPHHGSSTSSSQGMLDAVSPIWTVVSSAFGNRFEFPRSDVLQRYAMSGIPVLNTAQCGGIRMLSDGKGDMEIRSARVHRKAIWRWPAGPACP